MEVKASISPLHKEIEQEVSQDVAIVRASVVIKVQGGCHQVVPRIYDLWFMPTGPTTSMPLHTIVHWSAQTLKEEVSVLSKLR